MPNTKQAAIATAHKDLIWEEIDGLFKANYCGLAIEIEVFEGESNWAVYDLRGDLWLEGFCCDLAEGQVEWFKALKARISKVLVYLDK